MNFVNEFSKNPQKSNFGKKLPVDAELFHLDGETNTMKATVVLRNFVKVPKNRPRPFSSKFTNYSSKDVHLHITYGPPEVHQLTKITFGITGLHNGFASESVLLR